MLRFAVNISMIGHPLPLVDRLRQVADAGFRGVEFWFPHQFDLADMVSRTSDLGLEVALFDLEPSETHPYGHVADPGAEDEFFRRLDDALDTARLLRCRTLNVLQGARIEALSLEHQIEVAVERLRRAAPRASDAGVLLCIEAINAFDRPGSFCDRSAVGLAIVEAVGSPSVRFQYDVYHLQLIEGNIVNTLRAQIGNIGHVQFADPPTRQEPGTGEINFSTVMATLEDVGYGGWVSLEYWPSGKGDPFAWLPAAKRG